MTQHDAAARASEVLQGWVSFMAKEHYADNAEVNWTPFGTTAAVIRRWAALEAQAAAVAELVRAAREMRRFIGGLDTSVLDPHYVIQAGEMLRDRVQPALAPFEEVADA